MLPVLNLTKMIGVNFASAFPDCYKFIFLEILKYWESIYIAVNYDFN